MTALLLLAVLVLVLLNGFFVAAEVALVRGRRARVPALPLLAVRVLVLLNGFFVAAEFALVRVRRSRMEEDAEQGQRGARMVVHQLDDLSRYLAACQLGITLTSLGIGFLGEPAVASIFENLIGDSVPHGVSLAISLALA